MSYASGHSSLSVSSLPVTPKRNAFASSFALPDATSSPNCAYTNERWYRDRAQGPSSIPVFR